MDLNQKVQIYQKSIRKLEDKYVVLRDDIAKLKTRVLNVLEEFLNKYKMI